MGFTVRCNLPVKVCHSSRMAFPKEVLGVCPHRVTSVSIRFNPTFCETISRLLTRYWGSMNWIGYVGGKLWNENGTWNRFSTNLPAAVQCPCTPSYTGQKELGHATSLSSTLPLGEEQCFKQLWTSDHWNKWLFINKLSSFAVTFVNKLCCGFYNISTHKVI